MNPAANPAIIKRVTAINPRAFKALHNVLGFDFEQPFTLIAIDGPYTLNKLNKAVEQERGGTLGAVVAVLTHNPRSQRRKDLHLLAVKGSSIDIDFVHIGLGIDTFTRKSDFDEMRKMPNVEAFVFVQDRASLKPRQEKPVDYTGRFAVAPDRRYYYGYRGWDNHKYTIDKSGYVLDERRADLKKRAEMRRREREKTAYLNTDNTAKVEELRQMITVKRLNLAAELVNATTAEALEAVTDKLHHWKDGLVEIVRRFERFEKATAEKKFDSVTESDGLYQSILDSLNRI